MRRSLVILLLLLSVAALATTWLLYARRSCERVRRISQLESQLSNPDPNQSLAAADALLKLAPGRQDACMARAWSLMRLERYGDARRVLALLQGKTRPTQTGQVLGMYADALLAEATSIVSLASPTTIEADTGRTQDLLDEVAFLRDQLISLDSAAARVAMLEASELQIRLSLLCLVLRRQDHDLAGAQPGATVEQLRRRLNQLEHRLASACRKASALDLTNVRARQILFHLALDRGEIDGARAMAADIVEQPTLERDVAGKVALALLDLEHLSALECMATDVRLARRLLQHPNVSGAAMADFELAAVLLALREGNAVQAEQQVGAFLGESRNRGHLRGTCLMGFALVDQNRAGEAVQLLLPLNKRVRSTQVREALAVALAAAGRTGRARELLRQCVEMEPRNLPVRLRLAELLIEAGHIEAAEPHVHAAAELNWRHRRVMALQAHLIVDRADGLGIAKALNKEVEGRSPLPRWQDAAVAAAMALDDTDRIQDWLHQVPYEHTPGPLGYMAEAFTKVSPRTRFEVAAAILAVLMERFDADPLQRASIPRIAPCRPAGVTDQRGNGPAFNLEPLTRARYVIGPLAEAATLVDLAIERFGGQPQLLEMAVQLNLWLDRPDAVRYRFEQWSTADCQAKLSPLYEAIAAHLSDRAADVIAVSTSLAVRSAQSPTMRWLTLASRLRQNDREGVMREMMALLRVHPWSERALLLVVRDALRRGRLAQAQGWILMAQALNHELSLLSRGRLNLARGQPAVALHDMELLVRTLNPPSYLRRLVAEIRTRAHLALGQGEAIFGEFDSLAVMAKDPVMKWAMHLAAVDALAAAGRTTQAEALVRTISSSGQVPPRWRDLALASAEDLMKPVAFIDHVDGLLNTFPHDPILRLYKARAWARSGEREQAIALAQQVLTAHPASPRAVATMAELR